MTSQGGKPSELARRIAEVVVAPLVGEPMRYDLAITMSVPQAAERIDRELSSAGVFVPVDREKALMEEALRVIAHVPEYDGRFCMDRENCPNCYAQGTLAAIAEARAAQSEGGPAK